MKRISGAICAAALAIILAGAASAAAEGGAVGTWAIVSESQLGTLERTLKINDDMTGEYITEEKSFVVNDIKVDGDNLTLSIPYEIQGQEVTLAFTGTIDGDSLTGEFATDLGNATVTGTREGAAEAEPLLPPAELPGVWNIVVDSPLGVQEINFRINDDLTGVFENPEGDTEIKDIKLDGNALTFNFEIDMEGQALACQFEGVVSGKNVTGDVITDFGNATVTGSKAGAEAAVALPGTWTVTIDSDLGQQASVITFNEDMTGTLAVPTGDAELTDVKYEGNKLTFGFSFDLDGQELICTFEGMVTGSSLEGEIMTDFGNASVTGSKDGAEEAVDEAADAGSTAEALTGAVNLPGTWEIEAELPDGTVSIVEMTLAEADGAISGTMSTEIGEAVIKMVHVDGNNIHFTAAIDMGGVEAPLEVKGTTGGDKLTASATLDMEGQAMEITLTGTRVE